MRNYQKLYEIYKDTIIDNYERSFAEYIIEYISEMGGFDSLINELDELYFSTELSRELQYIIEELNAAEKDVENNYFKVDNVYFEPNEYIELLIDFIKLKRIIDKRILENKEYDQEYINEYFFDIIANKKESETANKVYTPIQLNTKLSNPKKLIDEIHKFLTDEEYIDCSLDLFKKHFLESSSDEKNILWIGKQAEITAFIQSLYDKNIISQNKERGNKVKITIDHFDFNEPNKKFNDKSLGKEFSIIKNDETLYPGIRNFFKKLKINFK